MIKLVNKTLFLNFLLLNACAFNEEIYNKKLHDKVLACAAGFSDDIQADLEAAYHKTNPDGGITTDFKENSQAVIFSSLPPIDRLKAYKDYIQCIESNEVYKK